MTINKQEFDEVFKHLKKNSTVAILVQMNPDPDCLGAAAGFSVLLQEIYGLKSKIYHFGEVSHPQNKSMTNILHIALNDGNEFDLDKIDATVVLDTDLTSTGFQSEDLQSVDVRIDHHMLDRDTLPRYQDVRLVGSTCSIVCEYLREFGVDLSKHPYAATALCLGIKTDTLDFTTSNTTQLDRGSYSYLLSFANQEALAKVMNFSLPKALFETEALAYKEKRIKNVSLVSYVGELTSHNRDIIPAIADRFLRMEGIQTVVIMGVVENDLIASIRSTDSTVNVSELCGKSFGKKFSGAKEGCGGARVPLGAAMEFIGAKEVRAIVLSEIVNGITEKIFTSLGEDIQNIS